MDVVENEIIKELSKKYNKNEKVIQFMVKKCMDLNYNINEGKKIIEEFWMIWFFNAIN